MHEELERAGLRWTTVLTCLLVLLGGVAGAVLGALIAFEPRWPPSKGFSDVTPAAVIGFGAGMAFVLVLLAAGSRRALKRAWPTRELTPAPQLRPIAEGLAIARGIPVPSVWVVDSTAPNVACFPGPHGRHFVATSTAVAGLTRSELEAIMAVQLSLLLDPDVQRVRRAFVASGRLLWWIVMLGVIACVAMVVRNPTWAGLTINLGVWTVIALFAVLHLVRRRLRWSWGMLGDAVAIATTRHPEPLVTALRRLAGHNDGRAPVRSGFGTSDVYWAVSVRNNVTVSYMVVNDRARSRTSTAMLSDAALLLRARLVELCLLGGRPANLGTWSEAKRAIDRVALAAGDFGAGDNTIDGVAVTMDGAVGSVAPEHGSWAAAAAAAGASGGSSQLFARPRVPNAGDVAALAAS